jgi:hypothetical protein
MKVVAMIYSLNNLLVDTWTSREHYEKLKLRQLTLGSIQDLLRAVNYLPSLFL